MKRALAMALGAVMAAGSAAPASAASQIDFSGYYTVYYMSDTNLGKRNDNFRSRATLDPDTGQYVRGDRGTLTDAYWSHRLNIDLVFRATDEISVYWTLRAPDFKRFGSSSWRGYNDDQGRTGMVTHHVYGQIDQDWGTIRIGQIDDAYDSYGLGSLGYAPATDPMWTTVSPFDEGGRIDGLRYNHKWENGFGLTAQYQKVDNNRDDAVTNTFTAPDNRWSDQDFDRFIVEPTFEWDGGGAAFGIRYDRNATLFDSGYYGDGDYPDLDAKGQSWQFDKKNAWYINPAIMHSWGDFSIHFEGMAGWAQTDVTRKDRGIPGLMAAQRDLDEKGYAFFLDADYNYGPGNVTLAGWWASGTELGEGYGPSTDPGWDPTRYGKSKSLVSIDQGNFFPLIVAFNDSASGWGRESDSAVGIANNGYQFIDEALFRPGAGFLNDPAIAWQNQYDALRSYATTGGVDREIVKSYNNDSGSANHWAVSLSGNHAFTDDISLHYALAYLALNEPNYRVTDRANVDSALNVTGVRYHEQDKDLGFEADLGFSFQLMDNLQFVTSFGYMFNGDAYKSLRGYSYNNATGDVRAVWDNPDDSYVWYNTLTFSF